MTSTPSTLENVPYANLAPNPPASIARADEENDDALKAPINGDLNDGRPLNSGTCHEKNEILKTKRSTASGMIGKMGSLELVPENGPPLPPQWHLDETQVSDEKLNEVLNSEGRVSRMGNLEIIAPKDAPMPPPVAQTNERGGTTRITNEILPSLMSQDFSSEYREQLLLIEQNKEMREDRKIREIPLAENECEIAGSGILEDIVNGCDNNNENPPGDVIISLQNPSDVNRDYEREEPNSSSIGPTPPRADSQHTIEVPHAFLVEEEREQQSETDVVAILAEPLLPWWKQKHAKYSAAFMLLLGIALTTIIAMTLSSPDNPLVNDVVNTAVLTPVPSSSQFPSLTPTINPSNKESTSAPSSSQLPSLSPTGCTQKLMTNQQHFELAAFTDDDLSMDIDGNRAVFVTSNYLLFYSWVDGLWRRTDIFTEVCTHTMNPAVAISGQTAMVGCRNDKVNSNDPSGSLYIYEIDRVTGLWMKVQGPVIPDDQGSKNTLFGSSLDVDGDIAIVSSPWSNPESLYVFHRNETSWRQIEKIVAPDSCLEVTGLEVYSAVLDGNTIAIPSDCYEGSILTYKYNQNPETLISLYDQLNIPQNSDHSLIAASGNYIVLSSIGVGVDIFHIQQKSSQPFAPLQHFNASESGNYGFPFAIDAGILAVSDHETFFPEHWQIYVYTLNEIGNWEESIVIDLTGFKLTNIDISGRHLIAASYNDVRSFDLNECIQTIPTQPPTHADPTFHPTQSPSFFLTFIPTPYYEIIPLPSHAPTYSQFPTLIPSLSQSPSLSLIPSVNPSQSYPPSTSLTPSETCFVVEINVMFDQYPDETRWTINKFDFLDTRLNYTLEFESPSYDYSYFNTTDMKQVCLLEGRYEFSIFDLFGDGLCCDTGVGSYNITHDGLVIAQGGNFEFNETTTFSIPFTSGHPTSSLAPSESTPPSSASSHNQFF